MSKRIKVLCSWVLALTFLCLIVTGFTMMAHGEVLGLRGRTLKAVHTNLAIFCIVAGIGHLYFNLSTLCKYIWVKGAGPNMLGTFLVALAMTVAVIGFSATTPTRCEEGGGPGHRHEQGSGHRHEQGLGQGDGLGRGQGGPGRGLGPGGGRGRTLENTNESTTEVP